MFQHFTGKHNQLSSLLASLCVLHISKKCYLFIILCISVTSSLKTKALYNQSIYSFHLRTIHKYFSPSVSLPDEDYWKRDDDYWDADPTSSRPESETETTDIPYDYWKPEEEDPAVTDVYDDYWKPEDKEPTAPVTDIYDDYWKPEEKEPYAPVTDNYDSYWKEEDPTPPTPEVDGKVGTDDYWDATCMSDSWFLLAFFKHFC